MCTIWCRRGALKPVVISSEKRQGKKRVTYVSDVSVSQSRDMRPWSLSVSCVQFYGIDESDFARQIQRTVGASAAQEEASVLVQVREPQSCVLIRSSHCAAGRAVR
jgi:hypothetical protein